MVVYNLNIKRISAMPSKTNTPLATALSV